MATRAVVKFHRGRPQNGHGFDIFRLGKVETRRNAGIARRAPVGFPSRLELKGDAAEQHRAAARSRQKPDRRVSIPLPSRGVMSGGVLGASLDR